MTISTLWSIPFDRPLFGLIIFIAVGLAALFLLSGGRLMWALGAVLRILFTFVTTPFTFLRNALENIAGAPDAEKDYERTRLFMLFRYNRLQYFLVLALALLALSGGVTAAVLTLYPKQEMEQSRILAERVAELREEIADLEAGQDGPQSVLAARRTEAREAWEEQARAIDAFVRDSGYSGPIILQLRNAPNQAAVARLRARLDEFMADCPTGPGWEGVAEDDCAPYRAFAEDLADRKEVELALARTRDEAEQAMARAARAEETDASRLERLNQQLERARERSQDASLLRGGWLRERAEAAFWILLRTLWLVLVFVWIGAAVIDIINWLILMMRGAEITQQEKLERRRAERGEG